MYRESLGFEQTYLKFIEIFIPQEYGKKTHSGNHLVDIADTSDGHCFDFYQINIFMKSTERFTDIMFKLTLNCLSITFEDLSL